MGREERGGVGLCQQRVTPSDGRPIALKIKVDKRMLLSAFKKEVLQPLMSPLTPEEFKVSAGRPAGQRFAASAPLSHDDCTFIFFFFFSFLLGLAHPLQVCRGGEEGACEPGRHAVAAQPRLLPGGLC